MWKPERGSLKMNRREFLRLSSGAVMGATAGTLPLLHNFSSPYIVGLGHNTDPYEATLRAISYTTWNPLNIAGKNVLIKPNLVKPDTGDSGVVTDPEVTRAVVDLCIQAGAASILIIETSHLGAYFTECGYDFFNSYHPTVALADIADLPYSLMAAPGGTAYTSFYLPDVVQDPNSYLISVAKLKVHNLAVVTLATKNLFGLPPVAPYETPPRLGRFGIHDRSFHQATVDLSLARPADFSVVDGIWGMEQFGPWGGIPRRMDVVVAGDNSLAVDDVCMLIMGVPAQKVSYILLATAMGLGPANLSQISIQGDSYEPTTFLLPPELPMVSPLRATPFYFNPSAGETVEITFRVNKACWSYVEIVEVSPFDTTMTQIRLLRDVINQPAGPDMVIWDGRSNGGEIVPAKAYGMRITVQGYETNPRVHFFGWVTVQSH